MSQKTDRNKNAFSVKKMKHINLVLIGAVLVCILAVLSAELFGKGRAGRQSVSESSDAVVIAEGESLEIPLSDITGTASFYQAEVDGTIMEVLAVRADDGSIRTAFNACQSCHTSGRGYYKAQGEEIVCQNCGFHFTADEVEIQAGGCNPWPIFEENKTVTDEVISISYDFLAASKDIFTSWNN